MTIIEAPAIYEVVEAPEGVDRKYGLFSVATFENLGDHAGLGIQWTSDACADVLQTQTACIDPSVAALIGDQCGATSTFDPFTLYYLDQDSVGGQSLDVHGTQARARFMSGEETAAETAVAEQLAAAAGAPVVVTIGISPREKLLSVLSTVEQDLAELTGKEGVIYMSRFAASMLSGWLVKDGQRLRTSLGTQVAAFGGGDLQTTMYGTGTIKSHRTALDVRATKVDQDNNDVSILVQRPYTFGFDCGALAATVSL